MSNCATQSRLKVAMTAQSHPIASHHITSHLIRLSHPGLAIYLHLWGSYDIRLEAISKKYSLLNSKFHFYSPLKKGYTGLTFLEALNN